MRAALPPGPSPSSRFGTAAYRSPVREDIVNAEEDVTTRATPVDRTRADPTVESHTLSEPPATRLLRVFAFDPSLSTEMANYEVSEVVTRIPWERDRCWQQKDGKLANEPGLLPGPIGDYLEVIDVDPAGGRAYKPVDLNDPHLLASNGLSPSEGNPKFHQQMVYAVAMTTIQHFERALGRQVLWSARAGKDDKGKRQYFSVQRLRVYPHALREENAYYDSAKKALLFGYFPACPELAADGMPGGMTFSCLSHDIIAHETTHAILDGMQRYFLEPGNRDVLAFHEAFADLVASSNTSPTRRSSATRSLGRLRTPGAQWMRRTR
jgi:hypothetical protein